MYHLLLVMRIRTFLFSPGLKEWEFVREVLSLYVNTGLMLRKCFFYDVREELLISNHAS